MLAGELPLSSGHVRKRAGSTLAFASQDPFILVGSTVRENVLFGRPYDEAAYQDVLDACGLNVDFAQLREGEDTMGVQLSGGQKARVALARAFYQDVDIMLFDSPLSAVDPKVGHQASSSAFFVCALMRCCVPLAH